MLAARRSSGEGLSEEAAKTCKAERSADPQAFAEKYGTNKNKKNAYGKCVSQTAKGPEGRR